MDDTTMLIVSAPSMESIAAALEEMILSASGWRAVFAADGDEESTTSMVKDEHIVLAALAATVYAEHVGPDATIIVGTDTRPTGPRLARAALVGLDAAGLSVVHGGVTASPEIMALAAATDEIDGFFYISASHNPVGHNGIKMGGSDGGVLDGTVVRSLIDRYRGLARDSETVRSLVASLSSRHSEPVQRALATTTAAKRDALDTYLRTAKLIAAGEGPRARECYEAFERSVAAAQPGLVIDFNGSARAASVDMDLYGSMGCKLAPINNVPGEIAHVIVPEGEGLAVCRDVLDARSSEDGSFVLGYTPDNDGDRGNLVARLSSGARALEAQEVFALAVIAELSWMVYTGTDLSRPTAVVVNGPTSMRIDRIAAAFGVSVARAEVGEANVVNLARNLRANGTQVRILGEGSNGGNITHPGAVRDPLQSVLAFLKLLYAPPVPGSPSPLEIWSKRSGTPFGAADESPADAAPSARLDWLVGSLPEFTTTSAFSAEAKLSIRTTDHAQLKRNFERLLPSAASRLPAGLSAALGVVAHEVVNYEGTNTLVGTGNRSGAERGGFKVEFKDAGGSARAYVWMRGSGTEPVFRVLVDVEGKRPELHNELLEWLRNLVEEADTTES